MARDLRVAALALARNGTAVFPLLDKKPINSNGFHGATLEKSEINKFDWDRANGIGAAVPEGTFVVDIDPRSGGDKTIESLRKAGLPLPQTRVHTTRGGGSHRFYRLPDECRESRLRGKLGPGVDIKAAGKGYVVVPPSPGYEVQHNGHPQGAPEWMVKELVKEPAKTDHSMGSLPKFFDTFEVGTDYGTAALEREVGRLLTTPLGERNNALNRAAFSMAQLVAGGELLEDEALKRLTEAGHHLTDDHEEVDQTIRSGWEAGLAEPREAPKNAVENPQVEHAFQLPKVDTGEEHFWLDWENADLTPPPFYHFPVLPKNAYIIVYGPTEAAKSITFLGLCIEASHKGVRSSVYSLENPSHIDIDRVKRLGPNPDHFRITNQMLDLNDDVQVHEMVKRETKWDCDLLVIDTYSHAFNSRTEDGNRKAIDFAIRVRHMMHQIGCTVILIDHTGYSDHGEPRDASAKRQQVDMAIKMDKEGVWAPNQDARWTMENTKSARFGNPFFARGRITDLPERGLKVQFDPGYEGEWRV